MGGGGGRGVKWEVEHFLVIILALFPYFLLFCYPYILLHFLGGRWSIRKEGEH